MNPTSAVRKPLGRLLALAATLALLAGCGNVIGPGKPLQLYTLDPQAPATSGPVVAASLSIATPEAEASLDTNRIALNRTSETMDYFADASWPDHLPLLLQSRLVESFEKDGRAASVARDTAGIQADYLLKSEIRSFQARYAAADAPPDVQLRIDVALVQVSTGKVVLRKEMSRLQRADQNALPAIIQAFNGATTAILRDIVDWTVRATPPLPVQEERRHR